MAPAPQTAKPIFVATHPRSVSTAFERVFMTRKDLKCIHEPFGDAFYYGPERLSKRYDGDGEEAVRSRESSGFHQVTYADVLERLRKDGEEGKRLFIKDIIHYLVPPSDHATYKNAKIAPSVSSQVSDADSNTKTKNPMVLPVDVLKQFHFTFLIRHPRRAIPSYYRCCIPPLNKMTGFDYFMPSEAGYRELRDVFEFLLAEGLIYDPRKEEKHGTENVDGTVRNGGGTSGTENGNSSSSNNNSGIKVCVIDADDLLDYPQEVVRQYCEHVGLDFDESMLEWGANQGCESFDKWKGFHEDAIGSSGLKPRASVRNPNVPKKVKTREQELAEWTEKFGAEGAKIIDETADANVEHYEFLKQWKMEVNLANGHADEKN